MSKRDVVIDVTADDITNGKRESDECPIALATHRAFPDAEGVEVDEISIDVWKDGKIVFEALIGEDGEEFVRKFDNYEPVKPIRLSLEFNIVEEPPCW